jgi:serine/threonine protein kinase
VSVSVSVSGCHLYNRMYILSYLSCDQLIHVCYLFLLIVHVVPGKTSQYRDKRYPVIVMDFLEGGDLFDAIHNRISTGQDITERFIALTFKSAMESLLSIHEKCYLHRDLKLENLVLSSSDGDPVVKIIDCGYFCEAPSDCVVRSRARVGTPGFVAPETLQPADDSEYREYSTKSDVWQAGCALYTLLSGESTGFITVCCVVLCCVVLCCVVFCCIVLCCIVLWCIVLCCVVLYSVVLCCIVLYSVVLCCIVLYSVV